MSIRDQLKHKIKVAGKFMREPTDAQLDAVIAAILQIQRSRPTDEDDWIAIAGRIIPGAGMNKQAGVDNSDLNALLIALQNVKPAGTRNQGGSGGSGGTGGTVRK